MSFFLKSSQASIAGGGTPATAVNVGTTKQRIVLAAATVNVAAGEVVHLLANKTSSGSAPYSAGDCYWFNPMGAGHGLYKVTGSGGTTLTVISTTWTPAFTGGGGTNAISATLEVDAGVVTGTVTISGTTYTITGTDPSPLTGTFTGGRNGSAVSMGPLEHYEWVAAPGAPGNPQSSAIGSTSATLSCDAPTTGGVVASYEVDIRAIGAPTWTTIPTPDATEQVSGLVPETDYEYRWRALGAQSTVSAYSSVATFLTQNAMTGGGEIVPVLVINTAGLPASVTITDEDSIAVAGATVVAQPGSIELGTSGINGIVSVTGLAAGNYSLTATKGSGTGSANIRMEGGPVITSPSTFSRVENTALVATLVASDPNNDPITWAILPGGDAALFAIGSTTGVLTFVTDPDFENPSDSGANNVYELTVSATANAQTVTQAITITITNGPEVIAEVHLVEPQSGLIRGRPGIPVRMRVLDQVSRPAEGVTISAQPGASYMPGNPTIYIGVTDANGYCVWENPPLGTFVGIAFFDNGL